MSVNRFKNGVLQKIAGAVGDAVPLINNFLTNQPGKGAADANTVYQLKNEIDSINNSLGELTTFNTIDVSLSLQKNVETEVYKYEATKDELIFMVGNFYIDGNVQAIGLCIIYLNNIEVSRYSLIGPNSTDGASTGISFIRNLQTNDVIKITILKNTGGHTELHLSSNKINQN